MENRQGEDRGTESLVVPSISELEGLRHSSNAWRSGRLRYDVADMLVVAQKQHRSREWWISINAPV